MPKASDYGPFDVFCIRDLWYAKDHTNFSCGPWDTKEEAESERDFMKLVQSVINEGVKAGLSQDDLISEIQRIKRPSDA